MILPDQTWVEHTANRCLTSSSSRIDTRLRKPGGLSPHRSWGSSVRCSAIGFLRYSCFYSAASQTFVTSYFSFFDKKVVGFMPTEHSMQSILSNRDSDGFIVNYFKETTQSLYFMLLISPNLLRFFSIKLFLSLPANCMMIYL